MAPALKNEHRSEVILFVDNREKRNQQDGHYLFERLEKNNVNCALKSLPLGDFLWVLRVYKSTTLPDQNEAKGKKKKKAVEQAAFTDYVLDFIVERKTADDLAASIMDGRYEEQKFRLKCCGINNVIYLVEGSPG
jgi:crossover junction endonuclease MUS81